MSNIPLKEAAILFGVSITTIRRWLENKDVQLKEGEKIGQSKTVTKKSVDQLLENENFMKGIKRDHQIRQPAVQNNSQLQKTLEQLLENQKIILEEIVKLKKSKHTPTDIVQVVTKRKTTKKDKTEQKPKIKQKETLHSREKVDLAKEAKIYIEKTILEGYAKVDIDPKGRGANLQKWLTGKNPNIRISTIQKWYDKAKKLRGNSL